MSKRQELDVTKTGLRYKDRIFMVAGYIEDYKLTYDEDILKDIVGTECSHTVKDFIPNKGYVKSDGYVFIYYNKGSEDINSEIPWFTVYTNSDGKPELEFIYPRERITMELFRIERVRDLFSIDRIIKEADASVPLVDQEIINNVLNARQCDFKPVNPDDDFLKKIVKTIGIAKGGDASRLKPKLQKPWQLANMMSAVNGESKISPLAFQSWMSLFGCDFTIIISDNGEDSGYPLNQTFTYSSEVGKVIAEEDINNHGNLRTGY